VCGEYGGGGAVDDGDVVFDGGDHANDEEEL
jgi:hypothetical protein